MRNTKEKEAMRNYHADLDGQLKPCYTDIDQCAHEFKVRARSVEEAMEAYARFLEEKHGLTSKFAEK